MQVSMNRETCPQCGAKVRAVYMGSHQGKYCLVKAQRVSVAERHRDRDGLAEAIRNEGPQTARRR